MFKKAQNVFPSFVIEIIMCININNLAKYKVKIKLKHARISKLPFNNLKLLKQTKNMLEYLNCP